jgi:hypothetical protein
MKNKNSVMHELDKIEGALSNLNFIIKRGESIESYVAAMGKIKDSVDQIRLYVENEQTSFR